MTQVSNIGQLKDALLLRAENGLKGALRNYLAAPLDWDLPAPIEVDAAFIANFTSDVTQIFNDKTLDNAQQKQKFNAYVMSHAINGNDPEELQFLVNATTAELNNKEKNALNHEEVAGFIAGETMKYIGARSTDKTTVFPPRRNSSRTEDDASEQPDSATLNRTRREEYYANNRVYVFDTRKEKEEYFQGVMNDVFKNENHSTGGYPRWAEKTVRNAKHDIERAILEFCADKNGGKEHYGDPISEDDFKQIVRQHANAVKTRQAEKSGGKRVEVIVANMLGAVSNLKEELHEQGIAVPMHEDNRGIFAKTKHYFAHKGSRLAMAARHTREGIWNVEDEPEGARSQTREEDDSGRTRSKVRSINHGKTSARTATSMLNLDSAGDDVPDMPGEEAASARVKAKRDDGEPKLGFREKTWVVLGSIVTGGVSASKTGRDWVVKTAKSGVSKTKEVWSSGVSKTKDFLFGTEVEEVVEEAAKKGLSKNAKIALGAAALGAVGYMVYNAMKPSEKWTDSVGQESMGRSR